MYYPTEAVKTLSDQWHGDKVSLAVFYGLLGQAAASLTALDKIKKTLFYGKNGDVLESGHTQNIPDSVAKAIGLTEQDAACLIHGIIGAATEAGELLEALLAIFETGKGDAVNLLEEVGDIKWYLAILSNLPAPYGFEWGADEARNIEKLRQRYPDKFTSEAAINRDTAAERKILEGGQ
jgi:NTP pyrophosphatase (non-canonical NTP hydrolase)